MIGDFALPDGLRLLLIIVAIVQALLAARVVAVRLWLRIVARQALHPERVPGAAMVAHGLACSYIAYTLLRRLDLGRPLDPVLIPFCIGILTFGAAAYTQIVVLTVRSNRAARSSGRAAQRRARRHQ